MTSSTIALLVIGHVAGIACGYLLGRSIVRRIICRSFRPRLVVWLGIVGGLVASIPALFLAMVVGGSVGGGLGAAMDETFGLKSAGAQIGLPIGVALVWTAVLAIGVAAGAGIGQLFTRVDSHTQAT
jgi:hypothetical protein